MTKALSLKEIENICQILECDKDKIYLLRNDLSNNYINLNDIKTKINQYINCFEMDIENILSFLKGIKCNLQNDNTNIFNKKYILKNKNNYFNSCEGFSYMCYDFCGCYPCYCYSNTNYCTANQSYNSINNSQNLNRIKSTEDLQKTGKFNINNNNNFNRANKYEPNLNRSMPSYLNNNYNNPNLSIDYYSLIKDNNNINNKNKRNNRYNSNEKVKNKNISLPIRNIKKSSPNFTNKKNLSKNQNKPIIKNKNSPENQNNEINNLKRYHNSKSFNKKGNFLSPKNDIKKLDENKDNKNKNINYNNYNNNYDNNNNNFINNNNDNLSKNNNNYNHYKKINNNKYNNNTYENKSNFDKKDKKNNLNNDSNKKSPVKNNKKINISIKAQNFINKLNRQQNGIINRFKELYGDDVKEKILNGEIKVEKIDEMDNILDKIKKMCIWGDNNSKNKNKRWISNSLNKTKKKNNINQIPLDDKIESYRNIFNNRQTNYREFPRGWFSTKEYFINNGTTVVN